MVERPGSCRQDADARSRIREAIIDLVLETSYEEVTLDRVFERAAVEEVEFYRHFNGKGDLYLKIFLEVYGRFHEAVTTAFNARDSWRDSLRDCAYAAARHIRDHPREVRFGMVHANDLAQVHRERQLHELVDLIDRGRQELDDPDSMGRSVAEGVIGSIYSMLSKELHNRRGVAGAESYVPEMMYIAVRPYLGQGAAREELTIPAPPERAAADA